MKGKGYYWYLVHHIKMFDNWKDKTGTKTHHKVTCPPAESSMDTGAELSEIDARLQALQDYMRDLDTGH